MTSEERLESPAIVPPSERVFGGPCASEWQSVGNGLDDEGPLHRQCHHLENDRAREQELEKERKGFSPCGHGDV
ncbi:hypothetical protein EYF80_027795 [Liparis tanakae]|uniref:Uncharacterized protein n=1 Tax=Liparis tanakae TaxID=230148 RepID=A0A4Z2H8W2_9TELE|nr:hypothetical protein EYF80_027795 [Liparis tanakae]